MLVCATRYLYKASISVLNSTAQENSASGDDGGGIYLSTSAYAAVTGSIISHNNATDKGGGLYLNKASATVRNRWVPLLKTISPLTPLCSTQFLD